MVPGSLKHPNVVLAGKAPGYLCFARSRCFGLRICLCPRQNVPPKPASHSVQQSCVFSYSLKSKTIWNPKRQLTSARVVLENLPSVPVRATTKLEYPTFCWVFHFFGGSVLMDKRMPNASSHLRGVEERGKMALLQKGSQIE